MTENKKAEILSPAGSFEMLTAAVRSGADAVYFGGKQFSARRGAENFDQTGLSEAVRYCKIRGVKSYLTLNILLKDSELSEAVSLALSAYNAGIDGIIVQDLGFARILHSHLPELPLHASTQMSVHSPGALPLLKEMGFCRVVAAREMSLEEIKLLCKKAGELSMSVEIFVHGALCMSLSGQCLLSSVLGSRSGNRGLCAGPCRLPFSVENGTGYDLSLKDLSLLQYMPELQKAGVCSFKIEGRMKRPEYVSAATAACRIALDTGRVDESLSQTLKNVFSRSGFTDGYLTGKLGRDMFGIRTRDDVLGAGEAFATAHELYRTERAGVPVSAAAVIRRGENLSLSLSDGENTITAYGDMPETAIKNELTEETAKKSLVKLGGTPYALERIKITLDSGLFVRAAELNELRRTACELLDEKRGAPRDNRGFTYYPCLPQRKPPARVKRYIRIENTEQLPDNLCGVDGVILALECNPQTDMPPDIEKIADIPKGIISENIIRKRLELFKQNGFDAAMCGNLAAVNIVREAGMRIFADTGLNLFNSEALFAAGQAGVSAAVMSAEILLADALKLKSPIPFGIISYGRLPLMLLRNCPAKNGKTCAECKGKSEITDRKGIKFPLRCRMGYTELLNSLPIWLADRGGELAGFDFTILYFTDETRDRVNEVLEAYRKGKKSDLPYTRGLYYRGAI